MAGKRKGTPQSSEYSQGRSTVCAHTASPLRWEAAHRPHDSAVCAKTQPAQGQERLATQPGEYTARACAR